MTTTTTTLEGLTAELGAAIASVEQEIAAVGAKITAVEADIKKVNDKISLVERAWDNATSEEEKKTLAVRETQLRDEKKQLRKMAEDLRDEKKQLRDKEKDLRDEKKDLRAKDMLMLSAWANRYSGVSLRSPAASGVGDKPFYFTPAGQTNASAIWKMCISGFGFLPAWTAFDPFPDSRVFSAFVPSAEDVQNANPPLRGFMAERPFVGLSGTPLKEVKQNGLQEILARVLKGGWNVLFIGGSTMDDVHAPVGLVTKRSEIDLAWKDENGVYGIFELKGADISTLFAMKQGVGYGTNAAISLLRFLSPHEIIVPVILCNGESIRFGVVVVLEPSFPTYIPLTGDINMFHEPKLVAAYLDKAKQYVDRMKAMVAMRKNNNETGMNHQFMLLDKNKYFFKRISPASSREDNNGLDLFASQSVPREEAFLTGFMHMSRCLNILYANKNTRDLVVFPLALRMENFERKAVNFDETTSDIATNTDGGSSVKGGGTESKKEDSATGNPGSSKKKKADGGSSVKGGGTESKKEDSATGNPGSSSKKTGSSSRAQSCPENAMLLEEHAIVFEDLTKHGFRIGTPHKINDKDLFYRYVRALESAVNAIHDAGVLHVDLYSSNIMWKESETVDDDGNKDVIIKIIDWDASHCLSEGSFHPNILERLVVNLPYTEVVFGKEHDLKYVNALKVERGAVADSVWDRLNTKDVSTVNTAFRELFEAFCLREITRKNNERAMKAKETKATKKFEEEEGEKCQREIKAAPVVVAEEKSAKDKDSDEEGQKKKHKDEKKEKKEKKKKKRKRKEEKENETTKKSKHMKEEEDRD